VGQSIADVGEPLTLRSLATLLTQSGWPDGSLCLHLHAVATSFKESQMPVRAAQLSGW
jgi:hypothetical protein